MYLCNIKITIKMETKFREILAYLFVLYFIMGGICLTGYFVSPTTVPYFDLLVLMPIVITGLVATIFYVLIPIVTWILDY